METLIDGLIAGAIVVALVMCCHVVEGYSDYRYWKKVNRRPKA